MLVPRSASGGVDPVDPRRTHRRDQPGGSLAVWAFLLWLACTPPASAYTPDDDYGRVADFSLTARSGKVIQRADLSGKVWIAAIIFTRCTGPCAQVSGSMANLQQDMASNKDVVLVSFTVDPEFDTPQVLDKYAQRYGADPERWLFLTGERDKLYRLIRTSFLLGVERNEGPDA